MSSPPDHSLRSIESRVESLLRRVNLQTRSCARGAKLTVPQLHTLLAMTDTPRPTPAVVAALAGLSRSSMTNVLDRLERKGLLRRQHSSSDRRQVELVLTEQGEDLTASLRRPVRVTLEASLRTFDSEQLERIEEGLALLQHALDRQG